MSVRLSVCLSVTVCPSVTRWHWVKTAQARITTSSMTDSTKTPVLAKKVEPEVPKGSPLARALYESGVGKIRNFQPITQKRCKIGSKLLLITNRKLHTSSAHSRAARSRWWGRWKCETGKCETGIIGIILQGVENAGLENSGTRNAWNATCGIT